MINEPAATGPIRLTAQSTVTLRPATAARIDGGLWAERRATNRTVSVPEAWDRLQEAGNFHNLALAAGTTTGDYINDLPFLDSDLYKWLEAVAWTLTDPELGEDLAEFLIMKIAESEHVLRAAQEPDGYLDSHFQVRFPGERFVQLAWGHELYCAGHLIQAAVAHHRSTGQPGLLEVAAKFADLIVDSFGTGPNQVDGVCGHPEIETALIELYRETGQDLYLATARYFIDNRGRGLLEKGRFGRQYFQDHLPVREAASVEGHAVRQLYLLAGVADLHAETGDPTLRTAAERLWQEMVSTKTYLTGGIGSHHADEAFGDPFELPNERSYCETCAAIASIMFSWRMLIMTGEAKYADLVERTLYNGFLAGLSVDGRGYIYANPLQVREGHLSRGSDGDYQRVRWFRCACCPPNVMRLLASLEHYVLLSSNDAIYLHQFIAGSYAGQTAGGEFAVTLATDYPWTGAIQIRIDRAPAKVSTLALRVPHWAIGAELRVNGELSTTQPRDGWWRLEREWRLGDLVDFEIPLAARFSVADSRVDATRGCVALERGPLVYCLETTDNRGHRLDELRIDTATLPTTQQVDSELGSLVQLTARGTAQATSNPDWWPYGGLSDAADAVEPVTLTALPYFLWGNREPGAMRVWIRT